MINLDDDPPPAPRARAACAACAACAAGGAEPAAASTAANASNAAWTASAGTPYPCKTVTSPKRPQQVGTSGAAQSWPAAAVQRMPSS